MTVSLLKENRGTIESRLRGIRESVESAAADTGRDPSGIKLIAVTKGFGTEALELADSLGLDAVGENRVRTAVDKQESLPEALVDRLEWHMIGHVQSNKVKYLLGKFSLLHSVDRGSLISELDKRLSREGLRQDVLLQVNVSGEESKYGATPEQAPEVLGEICESEVLIPRGLMTMAPRTDDQSVIRETFAGCRRLRDDLESQLNVDLPELSMGMTNDYPEAVREGATMLRIGRGLFGERPD